MIHVALMKKQLGHVDMILAGQKTIESRWYKRKRVPWGKVSAGEKVYFKNTGEPVRAVAKVKRVIEVPDLTPVVTDGLLEKYGKDICIKDKQKFYKRVKDKRYGIFVFLVEPKPIKPFHVNKKGFGALAGWLVARSLNEIKQPKQTKKS